MFDSEHIMQGHKMNLTMNEDWIGNKYIYLDWNVYKYMREPRKDKRDAEMIRLVNRLKVKYRFPYSIAHIKDRSSRFKAEYFRDVEEDFSFAESINERFMLVSGKEIERPEMIVICKLPMIECFNEYLNPTPNGGIIDNYEQDSLNFKNFLVDMSKVSRDHPLFDYIVKHNNVMSSDTLQEFITDLFPEIINSKDLYENLRAYANRLDINELLRRGDMALDTRLLLDQLLYYMAPMINSFKDDEDALANKWKNIVARWHKQTSCGEDTARILKDGYVLLDFHPLFNDKLKKNKNTLDNIIRDADHCFFASKAVYYVSEDERTRKKTKLIYKAYGIKTKVVSIEEFLSIFEPI